MNLISTFHYFATIQKFVVGAKKLWFPAAKKMKRKENQDKERRRTKIKRKQQSKIFQTKTFSIKSGQNSIK
jgi:hypothetical protein